MVLRENIMAMQNKVGAWGKMTPEHIAKMENVSMNIYYAYAYNRLNGTPYYIGKGKDNRAYEKHTSVHVPKDKSRIVKLHENLSEENALAKEIELIAFYGRKDNGTGILRNLTDGGEGPSGRIPSDETRKKLSEAKTGEKHPMYGRTGEKNPNYGKKLSDEHRRKLSEAQTGKKHSAETLQKISEALAGEKSPNYGKTFSDETRRKISEAKTGKKHSFEHRRKNSEANKAAWARRTSY